jgi:uncharacterized protein (DUF1330 family)
MTVNQQAEERVDGQIDELIAFYGEGGVLPRREQWKQLLLSEHDGRIAMVNFMKFREKALYEDEPESELSGGEAIGRYMAVSHPKVLEVGGTFLFTAAVDFVLIGEAEEWDAIGIVEYPNREAFLTLFQDPEYRKCHRHRVAGTLRHKMVMAKLA